MATMETRLENTLKARKETRKEIQKGIFEMMSRHSVSVIDCVEQEDCPTIFEGIAFDDTLTLDRISLTPDCGRVVFEGSGCYTDGNVLLGSMDIELLIWVYEWLTDNEEELFAE